MDRGNLNADSPSWTLVEDSGAQSPTHSFVSDASGLDLKDDRLVSPPIDLSSRSQLIFWHRFSFESGFDGALLEISMDGGDEWLNLVRWGGSFIEGGYNGVIDGASGSPIANEPAWTGESQPGMTRVVMDVRDPIAGGPYLLRWRLVLDPQAERSAPGTGWWIDDIRVTDLGIDCPPVTADDFVVTAKNTPISIQVLANDYDVDGGEPLTVTDVTPPMHGETSIQGTSQVTYAPEAGFEGQDSFSYTVCDHPGGGSQCSTGDVFVTVGGVQQVIADPRCQEPGVTIFTDNTGDSLTMQPYHDLERISIAEPPPPTVGSGKIVFIIKVASLSTLPPDTTWAITFKRPTGADHFVRMTTYPSGSPTFASGGGTNPSPVFTPGTPAEPASSFSSDGAIRIVVDRTRFGTLQPGQSLSSFLATVQILGGTIPVNADIAPNNQAPAGTYEVIGNDNCVANITPFAVDDSATVMTGFPTRLSLAANDADADGDPLTIVAATDPPNGSTAVNADNTVTYRSTCGFSGNDTFTYTISDGQGGTDSGQVTVRVRKTSRRGSIC